MRRKWDRKTRLNDKVKQEGGEMRKDKKMGAKVYLRRKKEENMRKDGMRKKEGKDKRK